jgi:hypothetical protein
MECCNACLCNISYGFVILALLLCLLSELKSLLIPWVLYGEIAYLRCTVKFLLYNFSNACCSVSIL